MISHLANHIALGGKSQSGTRQDWNLSSVISDSYSVCQIDEVDQVGWVTLALNPTP